MLNATRVNVRIDTLCFHYIQPINSASLYPLQNILYIIVKNIRYLLPNRGAWHFFNNTYLTNKVQEIRCTNQLRDSCRLTDVNPHFTAPWCRYHFKIISWCPIVASSEHERAANYRDVTMTDCSHGFLWTHDVEISELRDCLQSRELFGRWRHNCRGRIIHCSLRHTGRPNNLHILS